MGLDVSYWQGVLSQANWDTVRANGWEFVIVRAVHYSAPGETDAHGSPDPYFVNNITRAKNAGLKAGAYSFVRNTIRDPITEADFFLQYAAPYITSGYLRPVIDVEDGTTAVGAANLSAWINAWIDRVQAQTGVEAMIYCNSNYASNYLNSTVANRTPWIANWGQINGNPQTMNLSSSSMGVFGLPWIFWQYSNQGNGTGVSVPGISARVDLDVFNGTSATLLNYVIGGAPVISNVQATNITNTTATITWTTSAASSSQVQYGLTTSYGSSTAVDNTQVISHSMNLSSLSPNTLYHYRVISGNGNGSTTSGDFTFTTSGPPSISNVQATNITTSGATITWTTNAPANSQVKYGLTAAYGSQTALDATLLTSHSMVISGLSASTLYHYQAVSGNTYGSTQSADFTFTTASPPPLPIISNVAATNVTSTSATITWTTQVVSDSQVEYGATAAYGSSSALNSSQVTSHSVALTLLTGSTLYHYRVRSANTTGTVYSGDFTFTTAAPSAEVVIDNTDPGWANTSPGGAAWTSGSNALVPKIGTTYLYTAGIANTSEAAATRTCTWTPTLAQAGRYDVYVFYQIGANRTTSAPYKVVYHGGSLISVQNQYSSTPNQGDWFLIGQDLPFLAGNTGYVKLGNNAADSAFVSADAAKFVFKSGDSQPPTVPGNFTATVQTTSAIQLGWSASSDDFAVAGYRIYRNGSFLVATGATSVTDNGLTANTSYSYEVSAYDAANNESNKTSALARTTLSVAPTAGSVTPDAATVCTGGNVVWTAVGGFGEGKVAYYRYAWDQSPGHAFGGAEPQWSSGTLTLPAGATGTWYLHVQGYNSANVANGVFHYSVTANTCGGPTVTAAVSRKTHGAAGTYDIDVSATTAVEDRADGPTQVMVTFSGPIEGLGGLDSSDIVVLGASVGGLSINGNTLTILLSNVADADKVAMIFPGILGLGGGQPSPSMVCFGTLTGDVNGDGITNVFDLVTVRNDLNAAAGVGNFRNDVNADGTISIFDLVAVRNNQNQTITAACP